MAVKGGKQQAVANGEAAGLAGEALEPLVLRADPFYFV